MKKKMTIIFLSLAASIFLYSEAFSAWTQAKGHSYNSLGFSYYKTTKKFTTMEKTPKFNDEIMQYEEGDVASTHGELIRREEEEFTSKKITYYGEYGIIDTLTVIASIPWDWQKSNDAEKYGDNDGPSGIGDINLGLRYNLTQSLLGSGTVMSVQGEVKIPEAYKYENPLTHLSLGDGQYDASLLLQLGRGIGKGYAVFSGGYKYRFENEKIQDHEFKPSDQFKASISGGYALTPKISLLASLDWFRSVGNAKVSNELIANAPEAGIKAEHAEGELIKDSLGLEPYDLNWFIGVQYSITDTVQVVASYNTDLDGIGPFKTENYGLGETFGLSLVYIH